MRRRWTWILSLAAATGVGGPASSAAQGYRVRLETRFQSLSFRGVSIDSVPRSAVIADSDGGFVTADGYAASCAEAGTYCTFFRPGSTTKVSPVSGTADATLWGFGVPGLQLHLTVRGVGKLRDASWPGTEPAAQLLEGYASYTRDVLSVKLGRTHDYNRLGWVGFDGAALEIRPLGRALRVFGYGGRALARSFPLPVTSGDLNALGDSLELPTRDQILLAGGFGWFLSDFSGRVLYQREDRRGVNATVSERVAADWSIAPSEQVTVSGGGDYDLATAEWGKADVSLNYLTMDRRLRVTAGGRRAETRVDVAGGGRQQPRQQVVTPPPPAQQGVITVNTEPPSTVFIDGRDAGQTPVVEFGVTPGPHTIRVERPGYRTVTERVQVASGETVRKRWVLQEGSE